MNFDEAKNLVKKLNALFGGQINAEQAKAAISRLKEFEQKDAARAINEHRANFEFINWPQLYKACQPFVEPSAPTQRNSIPDMSFAQVIRQQRPDIDGRSDHEVILRFWRGDWFRYKSDADKRLDCLTESIKNGDAHKRLLEAGKTEDDIARIHEAALENHERNENGYRLKVETHCRGCLLAAGMQPDVVEGWVAAIFEDVEYFKNCLAELRGELPVCSGAP